MTLWLDHLNRVTILYQDQAPKHEPWTNTKCFLLRLVGRLNFICYIEKKNDKESRDWCDQILLSFIHMCLCFWFCHHQFDWKAYSLFEYLYYWVHKVKRIWVRQGAACKHIHYSDMKFIWWIYIILQKLRYVHSPVEMDASIILSRWYWCNSPSCGPPYQHCFS